VRKIKAAGYEHILPVPEIVMDNPRSFGNYDDSTNVLHTSNWKTMPDEMKGLFVQTAKSFNNGLSAKQFFELGAHKWIFIHEMGHWWRKCAHQTALPYHEEKAANRLAMAYWREKDPAFFNFMLKWFKGLAEHIPSPVPAGKDKENFFNSNYQKLPGGAAYTWYQATMIIEASKELPVLTFLQAITRSGN
jgi:hypothetical protein